MLSVLVGLMVTLTPPFSFAFSPTRSSFGRVTGRSPLTLDSGKGVAETYRWNEEAFELEVTVRVPAGTRAKDLRFKATPKSIDLRLAEDPGDLVLLDGSRPLRGKVDVDGTFWVFSDPENCDYREVTVTIEKMIYTPRDDFEVVEYDWKGVYVNDTEEVSERTYDEPEALDVREYAASLGVDIDNINMSMVDKTMFSSGMNLTKSGLDELSKAGLIKEVTRQADGQEFEIDEEGNQVPFSSLGRGIENDEIEQSSHSKNAKIPFIDTPSQWDSAVPVEVDRANNRTYVQTRNFTRAAFAEDSAKTNSLDTKDHGPSDPIDTLTIKRLREILKSQGLKVSGNKKELQDRLRQQVNSLLQGQQKL